MRIVGKILLGLLALVFVSGVAPWIFVDQNKIRGYVADQASEKIDRTVTLESIDGRISWDPEISLRGLVIANTKRGGSPYFGKIGSIALKLDGSELLKFRLAFHFVKIDGADLHLERDAKGNANWDFSQNPVAATATEAALPDERSEFPVIRALTIENSKLRYQDAVSDTDLLVNVNMAEGQAGALKNGLTLSGEGRFKNSRFRLKGSGASVLQLRDADKPYPFKLDANIGKTTIKFDGILPRQPGFDGIEGALQLKGPSLSRLFPITGIALPETPPYALRGNLKKAGKIVTFRSFKGDLGDSDLSGDLTVDSSSDRLTLSGTLKSKHLDFDDLAGLIGAAPGTGSGETASEEQKQLAAKRAASERILPDAPIDLERLQAMDAEVSYEAIRVKNKTLPIDNLKASVTLKDGHLTVSPLSFGVSGGRLDTTIKIDGSADPVRTDITAQAKRLPLATVLKTFVVKTAEPEDAAGVIGGTIRLQSTGNSVRTMLAKADGQVRLGMQDGRFGSLLIELIGLDIAESLMVLAGSNKNKKENIPLRCLILDLDAQKGIVRTRTIAIDTPDTLILGKGSIDLRQEKLELELEPHPRDKSVATARATILVSGTFKNPTVQPKMTEVATRVGLAAVLGVLLTPAAAILPFIDTGSDKKSPCERLATRPAGTAER